MYNIINIHIHTNLFICLFIYFYLNLFTVCLIVKKHFDCHILNRTISRQKHIFWFANKCKLVGKMCKSFSLCLNNKILSKHMIVLKCASNEALNIVVVVVYFLILSLALLVLLLLLLLLFLLLIKL